MVRLRRGELQPQHFTKPLQGSKSHITAVSSESGSQLVITWAELLDSATKAPLPVGSSPSVGSGLTQTSLISSLTWFSREYLGLDRSRGSAWSQPSPAGSVQWPILSTLYRGNAALHPLHMHWYSCSYCLLRTETCAFIFWKMLCSSQIHPSSLREH